MGFTTESFELAVTEEPDIHAIRDALSKGVESMEAVIEM